MSRPFKRGWRLRVLVAVMVAALSSAGAIADDDDPVETRSYPIRFRSLPESAVLVSSILSGEGEITLQPKLDRLVVQDRLSILNQIPSLLESFDLPPRKVEVSISLALGTQAEAGRTQPDDLHPRDRGIWEIAPITGFTAFDPLGKRSIVSVEGATVTTELSEDYRVIFEVDWVDDQRVKFKRFTLLRISRDEDGKERVTNLYSAEITLNAGRALLVGAAQSPNSKKALFFNLEANPR